MKTLNYTLKQFRTSKAKFDLERFKKPLAVDRPVPFYSWNERMEPSELKRQVRLIKQGGWGGAFVHSRIGLTTPYLGEEWFQAVKATIDACKQLDMKVWLYDEDKWPSGFSGGTVPLADPSFRIQTLIARPQGRPIPPDCESIGSPRGGLSFYVWTSPLGCDWFNGACYAGLMHKKAMRRFLKEAYESYYNRFKSHYGKVIAGEFTDEPCAIVRSRIPHASVEFSPELIPLFKARYGYDPIDHLRLLFTDDKDAPRFRLHYFRIANELFERHFSKQLGDWCGQHDIALTGHYLCEDTLFLQVLCGVKIMPNYRHQGIPGIDHLGRHVGNLLVAKQCQSVVNQYDKPRMLSELYGVDGGSLTFEDRAWIAAQQMCLGVNLLNPHLSLYTMTGCRKRDYPQNIFYQQPFWKKNHILDDGLSRVCAALSQGRYHPEMLALHPGESAFVNWQTLPNPEQSDELVDSDWQPLAPKAKEAIDKLDNELRILIETLLGAQRTFDLGDETILADDAKVVRKNKEPILRVGKMEYKLVIIPSMRTMAQSTLDLLEKFHSLGGKIIRCGEAPGLLEGAPGKRLSAFLDKIPSIKIENLPSRLEKIATPLVFLKELSNERKQKIYIHVRDFENRERLVYIVHLDRNQTVQADVHFSGDYREIFHLDPQTGNSHKLESVNDDNGVSVNLPFAPAQDHLLLLSPKKIAGKTISLVPSPIDREIPLSPEKWSVSRLDDNAITLDYAYWMREGEDWSNVSVPVIGLQEYLNSAKYRGPLYLRYPVRVKNLSRSRKVHLVVEYSERYVIRVNDREVRYKNLPAWLDFRYLPIDITGLLRKGDNNIELFCKDFQPGDPSSAKDHFARYGTEIESIYLAGDFAVHGAPLDEKPVAGHWRDFGLPPIKVQCFKHDSFAITNPLKKMRYGDTTLQGLPFYPGCLELTILLPRIPVGFRLFLSLERLDCPIAEVKVDGRQIGYIMRHPLELEIPSALCRACVPVSLTLYGTLRNLLGPHHNHEGELAAVGPPSFSARPDIDPKTGHNVWALDWARGKKALDWNDRYCMVSFGDLGSISLILRKE
jgi:hypothetical protein